MKVLIIIPAHNEEKTIDEVVQKVKNFADEILVIDDGSTDLTSEKAKKVGAQVLKHLINRGQGATLQTGHDYALKNNFDIVVDFDADGQHQPQDIANLLEPIKQGKADIVFGSRFLNQPADKTKMPFSKKWMVLKPAIFLNNFLTGLKLSDAHNGLRALNRLALEKIKITQDRMAHNTEISFLTKKYHLQYLEVPVNILYDKQYGQGFFAGLKILKELFIDKLILWLSK